MASLVVEHLLEVGKHNEAIAVSGVILEAYPAYGYILAKKGTAYYHLLKAEITDLYPKPEDIPAGKISRANHLFQNNQSAFNQAEELGWRQTSLQ